MDQVNPEGAVAPVETTTEPTKAPDGGQVEAVKPATETPVKPEGDEPKGVAKRIKELTDARRAAEAREERLLRLIEQQQARPSQPQPSDGEKEKGLADFGYDEKKYTAYVAERTAKTAAESARAEFEKLAREREAVSRRAVFDARAEAFAKTVEDYDEVLEGKWACSESMAEVIEESEEGPALAYYLAQNKDEAAKLAKLPPARAGVALAKLEDRLVSERKKAAEKSVTKAPPPAPKIDAADAALNVSTTSPESDKLSIKDWVAKERKRLAKKGT